MATALDVISGALKLLGVRAAEAPITDAEAQDGLESLNDMLNEWEIVRDISLGFETVDALQDVLSVSDGVIGGLKANLAVYMAPEYSREVSLSLERRAVMGMRAIQAYVLGFDVRYPDSLPIGSGNESESYASNGDSNVGTADRFYPPNS